MNPHPLRTLRCRFCGGRFQAREIDPALLRLFCPRCRDLYVAAERAVRRHGAEARVGAEVRIVAHGPHSVLIPANLRKRSGRAA